MNYIFLITALILLAIISIPVHSQNSSLPVKSINIQKDIDELDVYFQNMTEKQRQEKGSGYKPYNRWKWFIERRLDNTGKIPFGHRWNTFLDISKNGE